jgi:YVTN family beta-propeller protein
MIFFDTRFMRLYFFLILNILIGISIGLLNYDVYAQEVRQLHADTLSELVKGGNESEIPHIKVGNHPESMIVYKDKIYVSNGLDNTVSVIDADNNNKIADISVGKNPSNLAFNSDKNAIYVSNSGNNSVSIIDANNITKSIEEIPVGANPTDLIYDAGDYNIFVMNSGDHIISVINDSNKVTNVSISGPPDKMEFLNGKLYVTYDDNTTISIIDTVNDNTIKDIEVGRPSEMIGDWDRKEIYLINRDRNITVIDVEQDKIIKNIDVGRNSSNILIIPGKNQIYVSNPRDGSISVIDLVENKTKHVIEVGGSPQKMDFNHLTNSVYVIHTPDKSNSMSDTVSIIDANTDTKFKDILVGGPPSGIVFNPDKNSIYVTNSKDGTLSIIEGVEKKIVAKVLFDVEPFKSGIIQCDGYTTSAPLSQVIYLYSGDKCSAIPNPGFEFVNWREHFSYNTSKIIQSASSYFYEPFLNLIWPGRVEPEAIMDITKFGNFTATFKELPPPIPSEYPATLFAVVISAFIGSWLTPTVIEWRKTKNQSKKLEYYHNKINGLHGDGKLNISDICELDTLRDIVTDDYTRGKITKDQYEKLIEELSVNYREIFKNELVYFDSLSQNDRENKLTGLKNIVEDSYAMGKINEIQYNILKEKLSNYEKG